MVPLEIDKETGNLITKKALLAEKLYDENKSSNCKNTLDVYKYSSFEDIKEKGIWYLIPKFLNTATNNATSNIQEKMECTKTTFDYFGNNNKFSLLQSMQNLLNLKIPIYISDTQEPRTYINLENTEYDNDARKLTDANSFDMFYIINKRMIKNNIIFLDKCMNDENNIYCSPSLKSTQNYKKVVATLNPPQILREVLGHMYTWSLSPVNYRINIKDTLYVYDKFKIGETIFNADTIRKIKAMPYLFDKKICLRKKTGDTACITKEHIEMLRGDRSIQINTFVSIYPFTLYSETNFQGNELKFGFDYDKINELPSKNTWKSVKIEGPYKLVVYNSINGGESIRCSTVCNLKNIEKLDKDGKIEIKDPNKREDYIKCRAKCNTQHKCIYEKNNPNDTTSYKGRCIIKSNNISTNKIIVEKEVKDVKWEDGIKSISFLNEISSNSNIKLNPISQKCLTTSKFTGTNTYDTYMIVPEDCVNNKESQKFRIINSNPEKDTDDFYDDIVNSGHQHFHRHDVGEDHD